MTSYAATMQSVIVTYPDGHLDIRTGRIPMPPPAKLARALELNTMLHLHNVLTGFQYIWTKNGSVKMFDEKGILYEWLTKPTIQSAVLQSLHPTGETTIFKKDGTVIRPIRPYPLTSPTRVWNYTWPASSEILPVDGEPVGDWNNWDTMQEDMSHNCSSEEHATEQCGNFYEADDESHSHPDTGRCLEPDCIPCPECGDSYDGMDYGGLGCSRKCAYGDIIREHRSARWS